MPTEPPDHGSMLGPFSMKLPLDAEIDLDDVEYRAIVDRIIGTDEPGGTLSAFNSSI